MSRVARVLRSLIGRVSSEIGLGSIPQSDTSEKIILSSLALIKILKHGRAGIPMEVMGLMLGEYVDEFTISVVDVFSMPQCGNSVSVESIDPVYQATMLDMIRRVNRPETVVGWYHSHPGFGCWLSGIDISTQESFERLDERAVGLVIDPIQSVKGTVVIDCFRLIHKSFMFLNLDPRQINSNIGNCARPNVTALIHGLNKHYFSLVISYNRNKLEQNLLLALMKNSWIDDLKTKPINEAKEENIA
ncbi:26S proteasome non-ATPase regulatory subunit 14-like [Dermatophagoides farinae]|uniref:26S proteasome non-ATPase regulatory subunit 14-like n=1 Tax=Dermatophagoides farinae TaxID=6954 RepID=UPI003F626699